MKCCRQYVSEVSVSLYVAVVLFSMSTWMDVVGIWVEMPLLVTTLPEGWSLPSYLAIIIQLANVGPAVYAVVQKFHQRSAKEEGRSRATKRLDVEVVLTLVIIITAMLNIFLLSFLWPMTSVVGGRRHSVAMLTHMFPTALTSCMTSLVFLPYMARFPSSYISAHYMGQGFSGLVPGLIGLIQGAGSPPYCLRNSTQVTNSTFQNITNDMTLDAVGNFTVTMVVQSQEPLFSVQVFFFCLTALFLVSLAAFCSVNFSKCGRSVMINQVTDEPQHCEGEPNTGSIRNTYITEVDLSELNSSQLCQSVNANHRTDELTENENEQLKDDKCQELGECDNGTVALEKSREEPSAKVTPTKMQNRVFIWLLMVIGVVNALSNGLLPATESYTCLPYGYLVYTLAVRLSAVAASLASLASMFLPRASVRVVFVLTFVGLIIATFHMILALQSPNPVLRGYHLGDIIVVSIYADGFVYVLCKFRSVELITAG